MFHDDIWVRSCFLGVMYHNGIGGLHSGIIEKALEAILTTILTIEHIVTVFTLRTQTRPTRCDCRGLELLVLSVLCLFRDAFGSFRAHVPSC